MLFMSDNISFICFVNIIILTCVCFIIVNEFSGFSSLSNEQSNNQPFLLLCITLISITKKSGSPVSGFKARFTYTAGGLPILQLSYKNPDNFGAIDDPNKTKTLLYVTDCSQDCDKIEPKRPTPGQLKNENLYKPVAVPDLNFTPQTIVNRGTPSGNVSINIPVSEDLKLKIGGTYRIGVGITTNLPSIVGTEDYPFVYGDFIYTVIKLGDLAAPGPISELSGTFI